MKTDKSRGGVGNKPGAQKGGLREHIMNENRFVERGGVTLVYKISLGQDLEMTKT